MFGSGHHNRAKPAYETVHHLIHAILQDGLRSSVWRLRPFRFGMPIDDDEEATSDHK